MADGYHHGNLRAAVLEKAAEVIAREGPHSFSLRSLALELGVSHTAPRHHFGSREGVLNALAAEGFRELAARLRANRESGGGFLEAGVEYVRFATGHPAHFDVMFTPSLLSGDDAELNAARTAAFDELRAGVESLAEEGREVGDAAAAMVAGWSVVHGIATLSLTGNLEGSGFGDLFRGADLLTVTRRSAGLLFGPSAARGPSEGE
ncbi:TetR/AcrR family transcriptional regulator [Nocardiopsis alborubida]|uniref:TetR/AcrR family transcriptional regulator n=1 Tax=Nocardiopsis alborubida TaxID=146802 RepID=A0A7X6RTG8_9ACTN|nr:TetR/AcrR family transcriptional regulator [Nocardiopsis alborubida]NKZ01709.1 TetR/AcrR family transcriptional regulator [Nocardiopsis alborubida]